MASIAYPQAHALLFKEVYAPAFFAKLASYGIRPQTELEARQYLDLGAKLYGASQMEQVKTAQYRVGFVKQARDRLQQVLQHHYAMPSDSQVNGAMRVKTAAAALSRHPWIQQAVLACSGG